MTALYQDLNLSRHTERDRKRQKETERDRKRQKETERDRQRQKETERDRQRKTETIFDLFENLNISTLVSLLIILLKCKQIIFIENL